MKKDFFKIVAFVLLTPFVFQNCGDKKDVITELTSDNLTDLLQIGLYGKVKTVTKTHYSATWDATSKKPVVPEKFRSRYTMNYDEQGFQTGYKSESWRTNYTISADKKSATGVQEFFNDSEDIFTFDAQNRILTSVDARHYSSDPAVKIMEGDSERTVNIYENYFELTRDANYSITKITVKTDFSDVTILSFDYGANKTTKTYVYNDVERTAKETKIGKTSYSQDSTVTTFKLLATGKIDFTSGEGITYRPSTAAYQPVEKVQTISTKDDKGNITLSYELSTPYKEDGTLDETRTYVDSYTKTEYQYW